jgi:hypothetical protein
VPARRWRDPRLRRVFGMPLLLGLATVAGLLSALLGQGVWHVLSWILLSLPIAVVAWHLTR